MMFSFRKLIATATLLVALLLSLQQSTTTAFAPVAVSSRRSVSTSRTDTKLYFFGPKDDGSPGDYVCLDCGYVFTKGPKAWADLPNDWSCPPCGSIKRRFKKVPKGTAGKGK